MLSTSAEFSNTIPLSQSTPKTAVLMGSGAECIGGRRRRDFQLAMTLYSASRAQVARLSQRMMTPAGPIYISRRGICPLVRRSSCCSRFSSSQRRRKARRAIVCTDRGTPPLGLAARISEMSHILPPRSDQEQPKCRYTSRKAGEIAASPTVSNRPMRKCRPKPYLHPKRLLISSCGRFVNRCVFADERRTSTPNSTFSNFL